MKKEKHNKGNGTFSLNLLTQLMGRQMVEMKTLMRVLELRQFVKKHDRLPRLTQTQVNTLSSIPGWTWAV